MCVSRNVTILVFSHLLVQHDCFFAGGDPARFIIRPLAWMITSTNSELCCLSVLLEWTDIWAVTYWNRILQCFYSSMEWCIGMQRYPHDISTDKSQLRPYAYIYPPSFYYSVINFIQPYLHQFFDNSHSLNSYGKPSKRPFYWCQLCLEAISIGQDIK